jgi:hypothetical protein
MVTNIVWISYRWTTIQGLINIPPTPPEALPFLSLPSDSCHLFFVTG